MTWKQSIPIGLGLIVGLVAVALIGGALFASEQSEELLHLYKDYRAIGGKNAGGSSSSSSPSSGMELQGKWRGLTFAPIDSLTARAFGVKDGERGVIIAGADTPAQQLGGLAAGDVVTRVDTKTIADITDLYNVAQTIGPPQPAVVEVKRNGFPMTLVLPGAPPPGVVNSAPVNAAWNGTQLYCPRDGLVMPATAAAPSYRCPRCQGPLQPYPSAAQ